jgi:hypothetical protein
VFRKACQNWQMEFPLYHRDEKGKIVAKRNHLMDCMRYFCMTGVQIASYPPAIAQPEVTRATGGRIENRAAYPPGRPWRERAARRLRAALRRGVLRRPEPQERVHPLRREARTRPPTRGRRLLRKPEIMQAIDVRLAELSKHSVINAEYVRSKLKEIVERCMQAVPVMEKVRGEGGKTELVPTGEFKFDAGNANKALELLGKHLGMFSEHTGDDHREHELKALTQEQVDARIARMMEEHKRAHARAGRRVRLPANWRRAVLRRLAPGACRRGDESLGNLRESVEEEVGTPHER